MPTAYRLVLRRGVRRENVIARLSTSAPHGLWTFSIDLWRVEPSEDGPNDTSRTSLHVVEFASSQDEALRQLQILLVNAGWTIAHCCEYSIGAKCDVKDEHA
jgi:hypothetical protein